MTYVSTNDLVNALLDGNCPDVLVDGEQFRVAAYTKVDNGDIDFLLYHRQDATQDTTMGYPEEMGFDEPVWELA